MGNHEDFEIPRAKAPAKSAGRAALIVVGMALMTDMMLYGIAVPVLPALAKTFDSSSSSIGLLFAVYAMTMLVCMPLVGLWVDRAGARRPLLYGLAGLGLATLLFAYAPSYGLLVAARALQGASAAISWTAGLALLAASFPAEGRGAAMGTAMAAMSVGTLLGPPLGGFLFDHLGRSAPFLFGAAVAALDAAARIVLLKAAAEAPAPGEASAASLLRSGGMVSCLAMAAGGAAIIAALEPVVPQLASSSLGLSPTAIGLLFAAATLASALVYPIAGMASDRWSARRVAALGLAIAALAFAGLAFATSAAVLGACVVAAAIGAAFVLAPTASLIAKAAEGAKPPAYGTAFSLYNVAYASGLAAGPLAAGLAYGAAGIRPLALVGAVLIAAAAASLAARGSKTGGRASVGPG